VTVKIGPQGEVLDALPSGGEGLPPDVVDCVTSRVAQARFQPSAGGTVVVVPVSFTAP
jgi:hypothetical protein